MMSSLSTIVYSITRTMYGKPFMLSIASLLLPTQPHFACSDLLRIEPIGTWGDGRKVGLLLLLTSVHFLFFGLGLR